METSVINYEGKKPYSDWVKLENQVNNTPKVLSHAEFKKVKASRSIERVNRKGDEQKEAENSRILAVKHYANLKLPLVVLITLTSTGEVLPIEGKIEAEIQKQAKAIAEKWGKIIEFRKTVKGTGLCQSDILARCPVRIDLLINGKLKQDAVARLYYEVSQSRMSTLPAMVDGLLGNTIELLPFAKFEAK